MVWGGGGFFQMLHVDIPEIQAVSKPHCYSAHAKDNSLVQ